MLKKETFRNVETKFPKTDEVILRNLLPSNLYHQLSLLLQTTVKEKCNSDKYTFTEIVYTATNTNYGVFFLIRCKKKKIPKISSLISLCA